MISEFEALTEFLGADYSSFYIGLFVGSLFGVFAQQSRFCLRSAVVEFWRNQKGHMVPIWLLAFSFAFFLTQLQLFNQSIDISKIGYLNASGSLSGALIGGAIFGIGMILARGCASRLLILSATGNFRALLSWFLIAIVAEQTIRGFLAPSRSFIVGLYSISPSIRDMSLYLPEGSGLTVGFILLCFAFYLGVKAHLSLWQFVTAFGVGLAVILGWVLTGLHASVSFDIVSIESISFIGPSVEALKSLFALIPFKPGFETGMIGGVFVGSLLASLIAQEFKFAFFTKESGFVRYFIGATLMGFGGVLAVGCSVGAGLSGVSVLSLTALVSLVTMVIFAGLTDKLLNG